MSLKQSKTHKIGTLSWNI